MRLRNARVRTKVTALLLSLAALWTFAAWVTLREGVNILGVSRMDSEVSQPAEPLVAQLQLERRLALVQAGNPTADGRDKLRDARARTDELLAVYRKKSAGGSVKLATSKTADLRIAESVRATDALIKARPSLEQKSGSLNVLAEPYNAAIDAFLRMYDALATLDDEKFAADTRTLIKMFRTRELISREDAFTAGLIASRKFSPGDYVKFAQFVAVQRSNFEESLADLKDTDLTAYNALRNHQGMAELGLLENGVIDRGVRAGALPQRVAGQWNPTLTALLVDLDKIILSAGDRLVERAKPIALMVIVRLIMAGGLGFFAVVASVVLAITTARRLVQQLERLRDAAHELSDVRLPSVVERLGAGEQLDVATEAPPLEFGDDDIGKVGQAFNSVQEQAIRTAVEQAELRRGIRDILLSLARRSQALVHRQLTLLDAMERREIDTEELEDLFRVDHLATRMRRNAENLIILSGATPARGWRRPVAMVDVVRSAVAEVEDYTRVTVLPVGEVNLVGRAVADIAHLLAELIENAVSFSPPYTVAQISGHLVASGYAIEIEDRGLGMSDENLDLINRRIENPPEFNLSSSVQLGLYVVGKLAERYGVQVTLKRSPYGGTTAVVVIPRDLIEEGEGDKPSQPLTAVASVMSEPVQTDTFKTVGSGETPLAAPVAAGRTGPTPVPEPVAEETTPAGLPVRVPQASLAAPLREEPAEPEPVEEDPGRSPEEIRRIVGAFQIGAKRGRAASAESSESETE
ncbi:sensor histidine kinase [Actinocorallia longicatena]|uniref:histidine kinase n=1 Tax=Actinocorallia longicatena TaxID=111803 RepID=A0ABP6PYR4_9ACTN